MGGYRHVDEAKVRRPDDGHAPQKLCGYNEMLCEVSGEANGRPESGPRRIQPVRITVQVSKT